MKHTMIAAVAALGMAASTVAFGEQQRQDNGSPEDNLPANIEQLTHFGERPSWSPNGSKIAFMSKSFGDAFLLDVKTKQVRLLTQGPNAGFLRVQYLPNGDYLLIGARKFDDVYKTRYYDQEFWVLKAEGGQPIPLNEKVSEGVAISRKSMKIAWSNDFRTSSGELAEDECAIYTGDIVYSGDQPRVVNKKVAVSIKGHECRMEAQDFRNNDTELTYVIYRDTPSVRLADVYGVNLTTGKTTVFRQLKDEYNEIEGIFPDGRYALVESDREQLKPHGSKTLDLWRLRLEPNSKDFTRVTRFGDYPGYKATNPVVSPDGTSFAFQEGRSTDISGMGHGIFLFKMK